MHVQALSLPGVLIINPKVFADERGFFMESFNQRRFEEAIGRRVDFVQDNHSQSARNVLRGLHYQCEQTQGKLLRVIAGTVFDVAVDLRQGSPCFGKWVGVTLSAENKKQLWIPEGLAHGFLVLSESAEILYKATDYYAPAHERTLAWDDPAVAVDWPLPRGACPLLSTKDQQGLALGKVIPLKTGF